MVLDKLMVVELNLDLAFDSYENIESANYSSLNNQKYWHKNLKDWLKYIRSDNQYLCPPLVRSCHYLSLGLQFTDDASISKINERWLKKCQPTDVLSFPLIDHHSISPPQDQYLELGDIIVSVETAKKQAVDNNHSLGKEISWLVSHGLLHLLGWDHQTDTSLNEMLNFQDKLINITDNLRTVDFRGSES